jgi:hypothetical protein
MNGPEHLRIGHAERDAVAAALHEHFAQGRLTRDELDERLDTTLAAKTVGDLRQITADLPDSPPVGGFPHRPAGHAPQRRDPRGWRRRPFPPMLRVLAVGLLVTALLGGLKAVGIFLLLWAVMFLLQRAHLWHHGDRRQRPARR